MCALIAVAHTRCCPRRFDIRQNLTPTDAAAAASSTNSNTSATKSNSPQPPDSQPGSGKLRETADDGKEWPSGRQQEASNDARSPWRDARAVQRRVAGTAPQFGRHDIETGRQLAGEAYRKMAQAGDSISDFGPERPLCQDAYYVADECSLKLAK